MAIPTSLSTIPEPPIEAVRAVIREAEADADAAATLLDAVGFRANLGPDQKVRLPARVLLGLGLAMRLFRWEAAGIRLHLEAGLPTGKEFLMAVCASATEPGGGPADVMVASALNTVQDIQVYGLSWCGPTDLGADVVLGTPEDETLFLDGVAELLWAMRHPAGDP